jgi:hypothetical protein
MARTASGGLAAIRRASAVVAVQQVTSATSSRHAGSRHAKDGAELLAEPAPGRQASQVLLRDSILSGYPLPGVRRVRILKPAIGVGDLDAVQHLDDRTALRIRVTQIRLPDERVAKPIPTDTIGSLGATGGQPHPPHLPSCDGKNCRMGAGFLQ